MSNQLIVVGKELGAETKAIARVGKLVDAYLAKIASGRNALPMMDKVIKAGQVLLSGEKLFKIANGQVFYALQSTVDEKSFAALCQEKFGITTPTAKKYSTIYQALFSGDYLYKLPDDPDTGEPYQVFDLSIKDMEMLAGLVASEDYDEDTAHMIFSGDGNWQEKKAAIREAKPGQVKRKTKKRKEKKIKYRQFKNGNMVVGSKTQKVRFGVLDVDNPSANVQALIIRANNALEKEFNT